MKTNTSLEKAFDVRDGQLIQFVTDRLIDAAADLSMRKNEEVRIAAPAWFRHAWARAYSRYIQEDVTAITVWDGHIVQPGYDFENLVLFVCGKEHIPHLVKKSSLSQFKDVIVDRYYRKIDNNGAEDSTR